MARGPGDARRADRNQADVGIGPVRRILEALRLHGPKTARELAQLLGGGPVAMRAHLRNLLAAGRVAYIEERRQIGRPVRRFHLTPAADDLFPKQYELFAVHLAEALAEGESSLEKVLTRWEDQLARHLAERLPEDPAARLRALAAHQASYGFMPSVQRRPEGLAIVEQNCPIARIAARFPQICRHEAALFGRTLSRSVELGCCQALGDPVCVFTVGDRTEGAAHTG